MLFFLIFTGLCVFQAKEAAVEKKLKTEVKVLDHRLAEMESNMSQLKIRIRKAHRIKDTVHAKQGIQQMMSLKKQMQRFSRLHQICSSMLDHVQEQAMMSTTSVVLQEFVTVHEDLIKECNLDKLVSQYQELQNNVEDIRGDIGSIGESLQEADSDELDWEKELELFIAEDASGDAPNSILQAPTPVQVDMSPSMPVVPVHDVRKYFTNTVPSRASPVKQAAM